MDPLMLYFIQVNIALTVLYLFYKLFFTKDTFFGLRRTVLMLIYLVSFLYPLFKMENWLQNAGSTDGLATVYSKIIPEIIIIGGNTSQTVNDSWIWITGIVLYLAGVLFLLSRTIWTLFSIQRNLSRCSTDTINGVEVRLLPEAQEPYSFFKWICIHPSTHTDKELDEILIHEQTHVKECHSIDILLAQLTIILCWFNPFVWLLRKEIRINHEYLADKHVITAGHDKKTYQYHLIGMQHQSMAAANLYNNFSVLPLKKRIKMLNKKRTRNIMKSKYLMLLPVAAMLLLFSNCVNKAKNGEQQATTEVKDSTTATNVAQTPKEEVEVAPATEETTSTSPNETIFEIVEVMPQYPGGMEACLKYLSKEIDYPKKAQDAGQQGRVIVQMVVSKKGKIIDPRIVRSVSPELDAEAIRVVKSMPDWKPGTQRGQAVNVKYTIPIMFKLK